MKKVTDSAALPVVLYVEDEESNWQVTELRLKSRFDLKWARTAEEACTLIRSAQGAFHAVLMDIQLKGSALDGIQLTRLMKHQSVEFVVPQFAKELPKVEAPVFFVTAFGSLHPEASLTAAGGEGVVPKPVDFLKLNTLLARVSVKRAMSALQK